MYLISNKYAINTLYSYSPEYAAPELFEHDKEYGVEVDIWALYNSIYKFNFVSMAKVQEMGKNPANGCEKRKKKKN